MTAHGLVAPTHRAIRKYYEIVAALQAQGVLNEMSVRSPFESLLQETARLKDWNFIAELSGKSGGALIRPDGTLRDRNSVACGIVIQIAGRSHYNGHKDRPNRGCGEV